MNRWPLLFLCFLILLPLSTPSLAAESATGPVRVFVSVLPLKYLVERVGGPHVSVEVMVGPGQSPHTYEPTPRQMTKLSRTRVYYRCGLPFENVWMKRIADLNPDMRIVDLRDGIALRRLEDHAHDDHDHHDRHHADHEGAYDPDRILDPHIWTSPLLARAMAAHIRTSLEAIDPQHAPIYRAGYETLAADLTALDTQLRVRLAGIKNRKFLVFHPSWGYFADAYGLQQIAIEEAGKEPGPRALGRIIDLAKRENIRVIFVQQQFSRTTATTVARAIGGKVVAIDPLAEDYIDNLRKAADAFLTALEKKP
jgi:zinc transport system substrate-binding protein